MRSKRIPSFMYTMLLAIGFVWLFFNYQHLIDQVVVSQFKPSGEVSKVADEVQFTEKGKFLYLAAQPQLSDRDEFNKNCEKKAEQTVVLGCYLGPQHLYIYNITDPRLSGVRQVTAAHETLHVAYDRLSYVEKKSVNKMIKAALPSVQKAEPDLAARLEIYDKIEPGERDNELHSILGTESVTLPADLGKYYSQYFTNRSIITNYAAQYDKVFEDVKNQQNQLMTDLDNLASEIKVLTADYNSETIKLNSDIEEFNQTANSQYSTQSEFNAARGELLTRRNELEDKRKTINSKVDEYETKRAKLEDLNIKVKDLNSKIDSSSVPSL